MNIDLIDKYNNSTEEDLDNAQLEVNTYIFNLSSIKSIKEINIILNKFLIGQIDFINLKKYDDKNIIINITYENEIDEDNEHSGITNIINLPESLIKFVCINQSLTNKYFNINNISYKNLTHLNLSNNYIEGTIDLINFKRLNTAIFENNNIDKIINLPITLKNLNVNYNINLDKIYLLKNFLIENLYCRGIDTTIIGIRAITNIYKDDSNNVKIIYLSEIEKNQTDLIFYRNEYDKYANIIKKKIKYDDDIDEENTNENKIKKREQKKQNIKINKFESRDINDIKDSLDKYFKIKYQYETKLNKDKKKFYNLNKNNDKILQMNNIKGTCIKCKKNVGMTFNFENYHYYAKCNNNCGLNIDICIGDYELIEKSFNYINSIWKDNKYNIIIDKLNLIFKYEDNTDLFNEHLNDYKINNDLYIEYFNYNKNLYDNNIIKSDISKCLNEINIIKKSLNEKIKLYNEEFDETKKNNLIKEIINEQIEYLNPKINNLRNLKYKTMNINNDKLIQYSYDINDIEIYIQFEPKVISFVI